MTQYPLHFNRELPKNYFNTLNKSGEQLKEKEEKTRTQAEEILHIFNYNPSVNFTPWEIWGILKERYPITSVRRTISVLTKARFLEKMNEKRITGPYKESNYTWGIKGQEL
jgi:Fe2+ or Zn2+ uptake regulation protein